MEKQISDENVYEFLKLLVELGNVYYIDKDQIIMQTANDEPVGVKSSNGKAMRVALFKSGMPVMPDAIILNPLVENLAKNNEREWCFNHLCVFPGSILKHTLSTIVEAAASKKKDVDYSAMDVITNFMDKIDMKMLGEIDKIKAVEWGYIFYDNKTHTAQLQSDIFNEELEKKLKGKIRKSSWEVFRGFMQMVFGTDKIEEHFTYTGTMVAIPKADAIFHVLIAAVSKMSSVVKKATDLDLHPTLLKNHLQNLEPYQKLMGWFSTGTAQNDNQKSVPASTLPWKKSRIPEGSSVPMPGGAVSSGGVPKNALPAGVLTNPFMTPMSAAGATTTPSGVPLPQMNASYNGMPILPTTGPVLMNPLMQPTLPCMSTPGRTASGVPLAGQAPLAV